jgi:adenylate cyclase
MNARMTGDPPLTESDVTLALAAPAVAPASSVPVIGSGGRLFADPGAAALALEKSLKGLSPEALRSMIRIRDWLLTEAREKKDQDSLLATLAEQLNAAGVPIDRASMTTETLHTEHAAVTSLWFKNGGSERRAFPYSGGAKDTYERSPFYHVHQTRQPLLLDLRETPDERFGIIPELKEAGYIGYACFPVFFTNGDENGVSFATKAPEGFSKSHMTMLEGIVPALAAAMEIRAGYATLDQILRVYIGDEPHQRVLSGDVRRGQVSRIRSAILFADMRNYTRLTSNMHPEDVVGMLNVYFDCLVPPIEAEGGEVLKYLGDGLLAIFRDRGDDTGSAAQSALSAALDALARIDAANASGVAGVPLQAGIALHHGEAAYGNVGSGQRLDFTVVGRDVNLTSRIAGLNKILGEPLLLSRAFVEHLWADPRSLGLFELDGLDGSFEIYSP